MKHFIMGLLTLGILGIAGCENTDLRKCRDDNQKLTSELARTKQTLEQEENTSNNMIATLLSEGQKDTQKIKDLQDKLRILQNERNQLLKQVNQLKAKMLSLEKKLEEKKN